LRLLAESGGVALRAVPEIVAISLRSLQMAPLVLRERSGLAQRLATHELDPRPIFIIGHYRSGTTYLHNLLGCDAALAYPSTFQVFFPEVFLGAEDMLGPIFRKTLPARRPFDHVRLDPDLPHEDEFALGNASRYSFYHGLCFPKRMRRHFERGVLLVDPPDREAWKHLYRQFLTKVSLQAQGRPLVLKNPAHSARIELLLEMFPEARFIHIYRNPFAVYLSTTHFFRTFISVYGFQRVSEPELQELVWYVYEQLMGRLFADIPRIPAGQLTQVCYEHLLGAELPQLEAIYAALGLDGFDAARPAFAAHVAEQTEFRTNAHALDDATRRRIVQHWGFALDRLGYDESAPLTSGPSRQDPGNP
jgi:hypothetical protein